MSRAMPVAVFLARMRCWCRGIRAQRSIVWMPLGYSLPCRCLELAWHNETESLYCEHMNVPDDARTCIVFDFETTGISPTQGDRSIEIGAIRLQDGKIVDRFQSLMHPGRRISSFIENFTGISNAMLVDAEPCAVVMQRFFDFAGDSNLVAHNASFDRRFLEAEYERIGHRHRGSFACSMLAARRLCPEAPNHRLGTMVDFLSLPNVGTFHRALADAEMTASLWLRLLELLGNRGPSNVSFTSMVRLCRTSKADLGKLVAQLCET